MVTRAPETTTFCGSVTLTVRAVFWANAARAAVESRRTERRRKRTEILLCTRKGWSMRFTPVSWLYEDVGGCVLHRPSVRLPTPRVRDSGGRKVLLTVARQRGSLTRFPARPQRRTSARTKGKLGKNERRVGA